MGGGGMMERIPGLDESLPRGPEDTEHHPKCPLSDDYECERCGEDEDHKRMDCICADLESDAKAGAAEAKADEIRERKLDKET
mgnify:CR=1 FL=1